MPTPRLLWPLALILATGCIPKKKYDALQAELDGVRSTLSADVAGRDATILSLQDALAKEQANLAALQAEYTTAKAGWEDEAGRMRAEQAELLKDKSRLKASVDEVKAALDDLARRKAQAEERVAAYKDMLDRFKSLIDAGRLKVKIVDGRMVVELATDILFASGKADLSDAGKAALAEVGAVLKDIPDRGYQVEGHTDNVPIKTTQYPSNWELGSGRAVTVVRTLIEAGVAPERISAASFGEHRPVGDNGTTEGKAANRRIEIVVVPDLSQLPGFEELQALAGN